MKIFQVLSTAYVTILEKDIISVAAANEADAHEMAKDAFKEAMNEKYGWCDYDDIHIEECVEL